MPFFNWARWARSWSRRPQIRTYRRRSPASRKRGLGFLGLNLEGLEERVVPAVLPEPTVAGQATILVPANPADTPPGSVSLDGFSPSVAQNPINSQKLVAVYASTSGLLGIAFSTNGGGSWRGLHNTDPGQAPLDTLGPLANLLDPPLNGTPPPPNPIPYALVTNATVAMDRSQNVYVTSIQRDAGNLSGALVLHKYNFAGATPALVFENKIIEQWYGVVDDFDPILNPVVAVDNNLATFDDPNTGVGNDQVDTLAAVNASRPAQPVYIVWNTDHSDPEDTANIITDFNPNVIKVVASSDGGVNFTTPMTVNNTGNVSASGDRYASPQILFSQGSTLADGRVPGGQLIFSWNDFAHSDFALVVDSSQPDSGNAANFINRSVTIAGTTGTIPDAVAGAPQGLIAAVTTGAGTGYSVGDILDVGVGGSGGPAGTFTTRAQLQVTSTGAGGTITGIAIQTVGAYTVLPDTVAGNTSTNVPVTGGSGANARFRLDFTAPSADVASVNNFTATVNAGNMPATFNIADLDVSIRLTHPHLTQISINLLTPGGLNIPLVLNRVDGLGAVLPPAPATPRGLADAANLGVLNGFQIGTIFDQSAPRPINDSSAIAPYTAHFKPESGNLDNALIVGQSGGSANILGDWTLTITDFKNDGTAPSPTPTLNGWSLHFSSDISRTGFGSDRVVAFGPETREMPLTGAKDGLYPKVTNASGTAGIGPGFSLAIDNTLGAFSPYSGRIYVAYTAVGGGGADTDIYSFYIDNLTPVGGTVGGKQGINDDAVWDDLIFGYPPLKLGPNDNFSEGNRPQFMPTIAVDQTTGTVGVMYYDGRWDASDAGNPPLGPFRVANSFQTSIDGGDTFSASVFLNTPKQAIDAIDITKTITIEPVPGNQGPAPVINSTTYDPGFGDRQSLIMNAGHVIPVFSSNENAAALNIKSANFTIAAGPRVIFGDMGPITADFVVPVGIQPPYNDTFTVDGTRQFDGFVVQFDRPVDIATVTRSQFTIVYRDTQTPAGLPGFTIPVDPGDTVTPLDAGGPFGLLGAPLVNQLATAFLVTLAVPRSAVGTYSYAVGNLAGPAVIRDKIKTVAAPATGNFVDQDQDAVTGQGTTYYSGLSVSVVYGGGSYSVGDVLTILGGTFTTAVQVTVLEVDPNSTPFINAITKVALTQVGSYSVLPANPVTVPLHFGFPILTATFDLKFSGLRNDIFAIPTPVNAPAFQLPYDQETLPLIIPGPYVVSTVPSGSSSVLRNIQTVTPVSSGSGYAVGDILTVVGGTSLSPGQILVTSVTTPSGFIVDATLYSAGGYSVTPANAVSVTGGSGVGATFDLTYETIALNTTNNAIDVTFDRDITNGPTVTFGGGGSGATAIATVSAGGIVSITMTSNGTGYAPVTPVTISGGGGSGATATATVVGGVITSVTVTAPGTGYQPASFTPANILRVAGPVGPITTYTAPPSVVFTAPPVGAGNRRATGTPVLGPGGQVLSVTILDGGAGYLVPPVLAFNGATGAGAVAVASLSGGSVSGVTITNGGSGYSMPTTVIPDLGTLNSTLVVNDTLLVNNVSVGVNISHARLSDLSLTLIAPDGTQVPLLYAGGATGANLGNGGFSTIFDDYGATSIAAGIAPAIAPYTSALYRPVPGVISSLVYTGGSLYSVGDILTVQGGTATIPAQLQVTSIGTGGVITGIKVLQLGAYTVQPFSPAAVIGGSGVGATFNLSFGALGLLTGKSYQGNWTLRVTDSAAGVSGTLNSWALNPMTVTPLTNRTFRVTIPTQTISGTYAVQVGPDPAGNYIKDITLKTAAVADAGNGSGYTVGQVLTVNGGTFTQQAQLMVTAVNGSGGITSAMVIRPGAYTVNPSNAATVSFGTATFNLTFGHEVDINLNAGVDVLRGGDPNNGTIVSNPYTTGTINTSLPAGATVNSTLNVADSFLVQGATVTFSITHPFDPDLEAWLIAPDGTSVKLFTAVGRTGIIKANFTNTTLDDFASVPIQNAAAPFSGTFNPQLPLSAFKNRGALGNWTLRIKSNSSTNTGTLVYWTLNLKSSVPGSGLGEKSADAFTGNFRIFTQDPTNAVSQESWTAVGGASLQSGEGSGRVGGLAVDPSDPSGNTVFAAGGTGGVWKTTNFLTSNPGGPTWIPLTDFGPLYSLEIGSIAVFNNTGDPNKTMVFVATGDGDTLTPGVGFLRSLDGGRTWNVLDGLTNAVTTGNKLPGETIGSILPINDSRRDHGLVGATSFKIIADPVAQANGEVVLFAALSDSYYSTGLGGTYRSTDTGKTWTRFTVGGASAPTDATDVVLAAGSAANFNNLILYAAYKGAPGGIYFTANALSATGLTLLSGGQGVPLFRDMDGTPPNNVQITVQAPLGTPTVNSGRVVLAAPALTGNPLQDKLYQGWLYAVVVTVDGDFQGMYLTKDFGLNWTKVRLPYSGTNVTGGNAIPTNDEQANNAADYGVFANGQGNYNVTLTVDPNNAQVVYLGGGGPRPWQFIRVDTTTTSDAHAMVAWDNSNNDTGFMQFVTTGGVGVKPGASSAGYGILDPNTDHSTIELGSAGADGLPGDAFYNLLRDPANPFVSNSTFWFTNVDPATGFQNNGQDTRWQPFAESTNPRPWDGGGMSYADVHEVVAFRDPLTGRTRLIFGNDKYYDNTGIAEIHRILA